MFASRKISILPRDFFIECFFSRGLVFWRFFFLLWNSHVPLNAIIILMNKHSWHFFSISDCRLFEL